MNSVYFFCRKIFFRKKFLSCAKIDIVNMGDSISYCKSCYGKLKLSFPVEQVRLNGDSVCVYGSIRDAADATGIPYSQIYACVMGKTRRCHGFIWRKADVVGE